MPRFSEQFIQQVAQATDVVDLVGQYVPLTRKGREFVGLCPFHDDRKPSLNVSPAKQIFKCFACGAGGGVFNFLMLYDKLEFPEAVRALAERANIPLPAASADSTPRDGWSKNDLLPVMEFAWQFFREQLHGPAGAGALQYAQQRGLTGESIQRFGLGYAPASWDALIHAAREKRIGEAGLLAAGLVARRETGSGSYDRFRNRLIFPIQDLTGKIVAFGGRALAEEEPAKYLNSPDTVLFDKSSQLFALNWSRAQLVSAGQVVVVEGYLDALIPLQAGVGNVVATMGTALTDRHVRLLSRYATEAALVFDADAAGVAAAERALEIFLSQRIHVRVATIPAGKDPCDFVLGEGPEAFRALIAHAPDALQYIWDRRMAAYRAAKGNLSDQRGLVEDFLRLVVSSSAYGAIDEIRRGQLAQHIGHMLNVSAVDLQEQMRRAYRRVPRAGAAVPPDSGEPRRSLQAAAESQVLEVLLNRPDLFDEAAERIDPDDFAEGTLRAVAEEIWRRAPSGSLCLEELLGCERMAPHGQLLTDLAAVGEDRGNFEQTLAGAVEHIVYRRNRQEMERLKGSGYDEETLRRIGRRCRDVRRLPKIN
ncbi:MAG TPA: DNA primase [Phycisphaerae bacterium]|nr:DNA primase [Phycisphaerae bacterium]